MAKQNDWIVATLNNPDFSVSDFKNISGLSLANTQFLDEDVYKNSAFIKNQKQFQDNNGNFSEQKFNDFYNQAATSFRNFSIEDTVDNYQYDMWDPSAPANGKIKSINFNLSTVQNPDHYRIGVEGINTLTLSDKTRKELAQDSKIYDPKTGTYLNKSVNDISLFSNPIEYINSLFDDPLVYATYDEDTEEIDPVTGNKTLHKKGEWKVNEDGEYYVEKYDGQNLRNKEIVSTEDYITSEHSGLNAIDFFDSDDKEKSVSGIIAKNVAAVLPMFIPYVGTASKIGGLLKTIPTIYSGLLVSRELAKSLPMAYGMISALDDSNPDNKLVNTIAAYGQKFTGSTSEYAQQNTFAFENFGNMMSDVALQWGQQKFIANAFNKLSSGGEAAIKTAQDKAAKEYIEQANKYLQQYQEGKLSTAKLVSYIGLDKADNPMKVLESGKWAETAIGKAALDKYMPAAQKIFENRNKIGQGLSLAYMAIVSNTDVYDSVLEHGGTNQEAAAIAFGSTLGMFGVDKYLGLGEMFFQKDPARQALRKAAKENADLFMSGKKAAIDNMTTKSGIVNKIKKGVDVGKNIVNDFLGKYKDGTVGIVGKALGEGAEEVTEELVTDFSKSLGELAGKLGYFSQANYGAWENVADRYAMSFLGGFAGGAMFGGVEAWNNNNKNIQDFQTDLITLIRQGKKNEVLKEITELKNKGQLGSTELSYDTVTNSEGQETNVTADDNHISQAESNYRGLNNIINQIDSILNMNGLNLNDDEVFDKMVQGEYRAKALSDFLKGDNPDNVKEVSYISKYQDDFNELTNQIVEVDQSIQQLNNTTTDPKKRADLDYQQKLQDLQDKKQKLLEQKEYLFGEGSLGYVEKTLFAMDPVISNKFFTTNFHQFVRETTGKDSASLTNTEKETLKKIWEDISKNKKVTLDEAFNLYKQMEDHLTPDLQNINNLNLEQVSKELERIRKQDPDNKVLSLEDKLPTETDEEFNSLKEPIEGETQDQYNARVEAHKDAIKKYNLDNYLNWIQEFAKNPITSSDFRYFVSRVNILRHELEKYYLDQVTNGKHWYDLVTDSENLNKELKLQGQDIHNLIETIGINNQEQLRKEISSRINKTADNYIRSLYKDTFNYEYYNFLPTLQEINNMTDDEKEAIGIPSTYNYDVDSKGLSYADVYAVLSKEADQDGNNSVNNGGSYEEAFNNSWNEGLDIYANNAVNPEEFKALMIAIKDGDTVTKNALLSTEGATRIRSISDDEIKNRIAKQKDAIENEFFKNFDKFIKAVNESSQIKALNSLENSTLVNNPVIPILNKISTFHQPIKVEDLLKNIYDTYTHSEVDSEFQLSDIQISNLKQILQDLDIAETFIYGAKTIEGNVNPIGHNKQINNFVKNHKDVFKNAPELVEISKEDYSTLQSQINLYKREINQWLTKHENNSAQRDIKFIKASEALNSVIQDTFKLNRDGFKINDKIDLLKGYEDLTLDNSLSSVVAVKQLLYSNFIKSGLKVSDVLKALSPSIFNSKEVALLDRAKLDENLSFDKFTQYDKFQLIVSSLAVDPIKYYKQLKGFLESNNNIAPIAIQEYVSSLTFAQQQNPAVINEALDWLKESSQSKLAIAHNTTIVEGLGGSGKTFAVAKLNLETGKDTWLSGPTESQTSNLKKSLPDGVEKSKSELLDYIFGGKVPDLKQYFDKNEYLPKTEIPTVKVTDAPKYLVIDEITHFNTKEILSISKFCDENNIELLLIGDPHQNGSNSSTEDNRILSWKTPELFLSLRNASATKLKSQQEIISLIDRLAGNADKIGRTIYDDEFSNLKLTYYNQDTFNGDIITSDPQSIVSKIPKDAQIGFVGAISTELHKYLKDNGYNVTDVINPTAVQGQEFQYVIVDKNWKLEIGNDWTQNNINIQGFLKDLYTMITRSTQGTILVDNNLSNIIESQETKFSGQYKGLDSSVQKFREKRIPEIDKAIEENPEIINQTTQQSDVSSEQISQQNNEGEPPIPNNEDDDSAPESEPEIIENNVQEYQESINDEDEAHVIPDAPISVFSSISYSGINTSQKGNWVNDNNSTTDLGIFVKPGESIKGSEIKAAVFKVRQLKAVFQYGIENEYSSLPNEIKFKFSKEAFDNAKYFIKTESASDTNTLIGFTKGTGLTNEDRTYNGKIIKLIAKITGNDGIEYTLSLGGLNRPNTWVKNEDALKASIQRTITKVQQQIDNGEEPNIKIEELQKLYDNYHSTIVDYTNFIDELVKKDQEYELKFPPKFSKNCLLRQLDGFYRLEYMNSTLSPYNDLKPIQVESPIYILTKKDIPGLDPSLKGKPVMFISDNVLLNPVELKDIYLEQKQNNSYDNRQVRMLVLSNVGVSWKSLYDKDFKDLYNVERGSKTLTTPMRLRPFAIRMYQAMWNYRADLQRFLERVDDLAKQNNLSDLDLDRACQIDNEEYKRLRGDKSITEFTEDDYRKQCSQEVKEKVQFLWDFNDSLKDYVKEFRLGYEGKHGAYIRKLTNIENQFYEDPDKAYGIYMNIDIARKQMSIINNLFTNIVDKFIPAAKSNTKSFITGLLKTDSEKGEFKDWYKKLEATGNISMEFVDESGAPSTTSINISDQAQLASFAFTMIKASRYMGRQLFEGLNDYNDYIRELANEGIENPYTIQKKVGETSENLDWSSILQDLSESSIPNEKQGVYNYSPGLIPYSTDENGNSTGIYDSRLDDFFNLMFHGVVSTKKENTFLENEIRATGAEFKYGIFSDPVLKTTKGAETDELEVGETGTSRKLFKCNAVVSGPYIQIRLGQKINLESEQNAVTKTEVVPVASEQEILHNSLSNQLNKLDLYDSMSSALSKVSSKESYIKILNNEIQSKLQDWIQGTSLIDFNDLLLEVNSEGEPIYLKSQFNGDVAIIKQQGQSKILLLDNGKQIKLWYDEDKNQAKFDDITEKEQQKKEVKQIIEQTGKDINDNSIMTAPETREYYNNNVLNTLKGIESELDEDFIEEWTKIVETMTPGIGKILPKTENVLVNKLIEKIDEYMDLFENKDGVEKFIEALQEGRQNKCFI